MFRGWNESAGSKNQTQSRWMQNAEQQESCMFLGVKLSTHQKRRLHGTSLRGTDMVQCCLSSVDLQQLWYRLQPHVLHRFRWPHRECGKAVSSWKTTSMLPQNMIVSSSARLIHEKWGVAHCTVPHQYTSIQSIHIIFLFQLGYAVHFWNFAMKKKQKQTRFNQPPTPSWEFGESSRARSMSPAKCSWLRRCCARVP